jgi:hypothetical protein
VIFAKQISDVRQKLETFAQKNSEGKNWKKRIRCLAKNFRCYALFLDVIKKFVDAMKKL